MNKIATAMISIMISILFTGLSVWAVQRKQTVNLAPQGLNDLRHVVAFAQRIESEHKKLLRNEIILHGLSEVRHRCIRALNDERSVLAFDARVNQELAAHPQQGVYTSPVPARIYWRHFNALPALKKSIHSKIAEMLSSLPSQAMVTLFLNQKFTIASQNNQWSEIESELSGLTLNNPNGLIQNATIYLNSINNAVDGSLSGYRSCISLVNSLGIGGAR